MINTRSRPILRTDANFVKFARGLAFFQNHQNQKKEITLAIIPINNINYILNKEN